MLCESLQSTLQGVKIDVKYKIGIMLNNFNNNFTVTWLNRKSVLRCQKSLIKFARFRLRKFSLNSRSFLEETLNLVYFHIRLDAVEQPFVSILC